MTRSNHHPKAAAVAYLLLLAAAFALAGTTAVAAAMPRRVGSPDVTIPLVHRVNASQPLQRIAVLGDVGTGATDPFDALVLLGDNVYPDGDPARLDATVFEPFGPVLDSGAALLAVLGNHDQGHTEEQIAALGMPGRWYTTQLGDAVFIALDSTLAEDPAQLAWLDGTLAASNAE